MKHVTILFLALLLSNHAMADCIRSHQAALTDIEGSLETNAGLLLSLATPVAVSTSAVGGRAVPGDRILIGASVAGVAAGYALVEHEGIRYGDLVAVLGLLRESQIKKGLYLEKTTNQINRARGEQSRKVTSSEIAEVVNTLNLVQCESLEIISFSDFNKLILIALKVRDLENRK